MDFADHFSELARQYALHRPGYPDELYDHLAALAPDRELVWDCGTGSGQAAVALAERFEQVIATDPSEEQIANARPHPGVEYRVEQAEATSLPDRSADLVTVGTAVHWFDLDAFYAEVRRVARQEGILAVWTYHLPEIAPEVDPILERYFREVLGPYWAPQVDLLDRKYRTIPFPFEELPAPDFTSEASWTLDDLLGFLASWSAVTDYMDAQGHHPLERIHDSLREAWGPAGRVREVRWPLHLRVGRITGS